MNPCKHCGKDAGVCGNPICWDCAYTVISRRPASPSGIPTSVCREHGCNTVLTAETAAPADTKTGLSLTCSECKANVATPMLRQRCKPYGLAPAQFNQMLKSQNRRCAICKQNAKLCIDHHHASGEVRALLCYRCNIFVGYIERSPGLLPALLNYIVSHWKRVHIGANGADV